MKGVGWRLMFLIAFHLTIGIAEEVVSDLKTGDNSVEIKDDDESRSGAVSQTVETEDETVLDTEAKVPIMTSRDAATTEKPEPPETKRSFGVQHKVNDIILNTFKPGHFAAMADILDNYPKSLDRERIPDQNGYEYSPYPNSNALNQGMYSIRPESGIDGKPYSRLIPHSERIFLHNIPGASNLVTCSKEGELHNFWSSTYRCLVCACISDLGVLRPVCASCAGCMAPRPEVVEIEVDIPKPNPGGRPSIPERPTLPPIEEVTCRPLPSGQPFDNPLHPCQVCICTESINVYGKPDVSIKCQENPQCVLPTDITIIPSIPDVPVPSPFCDKFPLNVLFPHPSDACKTCQCSVQLSPSGVADKLITCLPNPDCTPNTPEVEIITEIPELYPLTPLYPIPIEPQIIPRPSPEPVPFIEVITPEPSAWTPATVPPAPPGPLPGPSPHDSCRPYVPNQPFQHPWDECQMCVCTEAFAKKHITIEISCFTKKSCCIESPYDVITPATLAPAPYQQMGKIKIQDAICEFKTFGVEFAHPKDSCKVCTCELQGHIITPLCKRSSKPECQVIAIYPTTDTSTIEDIVQGNADLPLPGISSYNAASSTLSQNNAIKNAYISYQNPYGQASSASSQSSADQQASYNQWNLQNTQRPGDLNFLGSQNLQRPGGALNYGSGYYGNGLQAGFPQSVQGQPGYQTKPGAYSQNYYPGYYSQGQGYPGYSGLGRPSEVTSQAQSKATASSSAASGFQSGAYYSPGYQTFSGNQGYPGLKGAKLQQFAQTSSSAQSNAQASSMSTIKYRGRSGNPKEEGKPSKESEEN